MTPQHDQLHDLLSRTGVRPQVQEAVERLDTVFQTLRRRLSKRELGHKAIAALGLDIDMAQLDILFAIDALNCGSGSETGAGETMVLSVAERINIDPSRASRLVAEMADAGYVRRVASQRDSRRTLLELTGPGQDVVRAVRAYKWLLLSDYLAGWSDTDLARFVPQLETFADWVNTSEAGEQRFAEEIGALAQSVKRVTDPA